MPSYLLAPFFSRCHQIRLFSLTELKKFHGWYVMSYVWCFMEMAANNNLARLFVLLRFQVWIFCWSFLKICNPDHFQQVSVLLPISVPLWRHGGGCHNQDLVLTITGSSCRTANNGDCHLDAAVAAVLSQLEHISSLKENKESHLIWQSCGSTVGGVVTIRLVRVRQCFFHS